MKPRVAPIILCAGVILLAGVVRDVIAYRDIRRDAVHRTDLPILSQLRVADTTPDAIITVVENDVFRPDRGQPDEEPAKEPPRVSSNSALIELRGIVGGPPWTAIASGVPERGGDVLLHVHDTIADIRVLDVSEKGVRLKQGDSVRFLRLRTGS